MFLCSTEWDDVRQWQRQQLVERVFRAYQREHTALWRNDLGSRRYLYARNVYYQGVYDGRSIFNSACTERHDGGDRRGWLVG
jgi:hypothetical protein